MITPSDYMCQEDLNEQGALAAERDASVVESSDLLSAAQKRERKARVDLVFCGNHPDVIARHLEEWKEADSALTALEQCLPEDNNLDRRQN